MIALDRAAVRRLRTGVVPQWELGRLSVGYGRVERVAAAAMDELKSLNSSDALFVRGEWGSGKTHLLSFVRAMAVARKFPCTSVDLNARSVALSHATRFYLPVVERIQCAEKMGLREILLGLLHTDASRARLAAFAVSDAACDLGWPLHDLCTRFASGDSMGVFDERAWSVLLGADLSWADYMYKREQALVRIGCLGKMFAAVGLGGLVVVLDEAETIDQLANIRSRMSAYGVLGRLCRLQSVWCLFGITERFDAIIHHDLERGALDYSFANEDAIWFLRRWKKGEFKTVKPPSLDVAGGRSLAVSILGLYATAYPGKYSEENVLRQCVDEWAKNPSRNPRRLIRVLIHQLDVDRPLRA